MGGRQKEREELKGVGKKIEVGKELKEVRGDKGHTERRIEGGRVDKKRELKVWGDKRREKN